MNAYLQIRSISKRFSGVTVLKNVSVDIAKGEIHVIIGENGAGKSTLMKIVAGMHQPDEGRILIDDREVKLANVLDGIKHGVSMIHQELLPVPFMTVAENIFLGREPKNRLGILDKKALRVNTQKLFAQIGINIDPRKLMRELSVAQIQLVEIAKAVSFNAEILIMDEPTSSLSEEEIEKLYRLIFQLKAKGIAIVFISHKLNEIFRVADKITVLRDGALIGTKHASELNKNTLIAMMIGRELANVYDKTELALGALEAIRSSKNDNKIIVTGIDAIKDALDSIKAGNLQATCFQDAIQQGEQALDMAVRAAKGEKISRNNIPFELVTKDNVDNYYSRIKLPGAK